MGPFYNPAVPFQIKLLTPDDLALLERTAPDVFDDPIDRRAAAEFLADPRHHLAVAVADGVIVGFASGVHYVHPDEPRPELWINEVAVAEAHRRKGIGRAVVEALLARGRALGCTEAWVATEHENLAAQRLYSACGAGASEDVALFTFLLAPGSDTAGADAEQGPPHPPLSVHIRSATPADAETWLGMRHALWPEGSAAEHRAEIEEYFAGRRAEPQEMLLAVDDAGRPLGFAELSLRPCAEDCMTSPVAYLEGWYVVPDARRSGVGRRLIEAAEDWGRRQGCSELASDTTLDNTVSAAAHRAAGFDDAGIVRCFRKSLGGPGGGDEATLSVTADECPTASAPAPLRFVHDLDDAVAERAAVDEA